MKKPSARVRLAKTDWLNAALALVVKTGVHGLKVKDLAASIGSTTGSLYWHFPDRRAFEIELLDHWARQSTETIAEAILETTATPADRLWKLLRLIHENAATSADLAIRGWAAHDEVAGKVLQKVDERRAEVVRGIFHEMGLRGPALTARTQLLIGYESCERFVLSSISESARRRLLRERYRLYCSLGD
jgi:AcrR family transcriptional regulator